MPHGKSNPKRGQASLGKALQRRRAHGQVLGESSLPYDADGSRARGKMTSILEASNLDDFIASAMLSERAFESHKESTVIIGPDGVEMDLDENGEVSEPGFARDESGTFDFEHMNVPRRPAWKSGMTAEELDTQEKKAFLEWRRGIANAEENNSGRKVTPFEKNLEVWRQLWRVMERSDLICQLVDARNPLFYYSTDLETYASELVPPKPVVVIVNKADYLSRMQQRDWARYFESRGVTVLYFSARQQQERLNREARGQRDQAEEIGGQPAAFDDDDDDDSEGSSGDCESASDREQDAASPEHRDAEASVNDYLGGNEPSRSDPPRAKSTPYRKPYGDAPRVLDRTEMCIELERLARTLGTEPDPERNAGRACVGMVGYPNVGKSSLINVLVGATPLSHGGVRVSVGATPGKTKHFQTLVLSKTLMLCDCPGLVFPSFVGSTAEMICAGVLPIQQMRNVMPPMTLIARRIPRHILELTYTIKLPLSENDAKDVEGKPMLSPQQLLEAYCQARGLFRARSLGEADMPRAARQILRDFTDGRLLFCHPPPEMEREATVRFIEETHKTALRTTKLAAKLVERLGKVGGKIGAAGRSVPPDVSDALMRADDVDIMADLVVYTTVTAKRSEGVDSSTEASGVRSKPTKRELGLLRWGKKGHKVSNKDPYGNNDMETPSMGLVGAKIAGGGKRGKRGKKRDEFTRVTLPHHQTYEGPV